MQLIKRLRQIFKKRDGMTMASVLVAFAIFAMTLLLFQQTITLASNVFRRSEALRRSTESLFSEFYLSGEYAAGTGTLYTFTDNKGGAFQLDSREGDFQAADSGYRVFYFGERS